MAVAGSNWTRAQAGPSSILTAFVPRQRLVKCSCVKSFLRMTLLRFLRLLRTRRTSATACPN